MSVYNIVWKRKLLETNLKSEEIINFDLVVCIFQYLYSDFFWKSCCVFFSQILLPVMGSGVTIRRIVD